MVARADPTAGEGGQPVDIERRATDSPYHDWPEVYNDERHRGAVDGVDLSIRLSGHPGVRGEPHRPDVSTRPKWRRRYVRKGG